MPPRKDSPPSSAVPLSRQPGTIASQASTTCGDTLVAERTLDRYSCIVRSSEVFLSMPFPAWVNPKVIVVGAFHDDGLSMFQQLGKPDEPLPEPPDHVCAPGQGNRHRRARLLQGPHPGLPRA